MSTMAPYYIKQFELPPVFIPSTEAQTALKTLYDSLKLCPEKDEIRLLRFLPTNAPDDPLELTMEIVSLEDQSINYNALSYCWGPPKFDYEVVCNGQRIPITRNLSLALLSVRYRIPSMAIWADQLCINQSDLEERKSQILLMRRIFSRCEMCLCHMGELDTYYQDAILYISYWLKKMGHVLDKKFYDIANDEEVDRIIGTNAGMDFLGIVSLLETASRSYFARTWIIQETAVASNALIICGRVLFPLIHFRLVFNERVATQVKKGMPRKFGKFTLRDAGHIMNKVSLLANFRNVISNPQLADALGDKLITLVEHAREHEVSDPRDKIFALQGIAEDGHHFPSPDYTKSIETVYKQFAETCCARGLGLHCLQAANMTTAKHNLPSWVPDWTANNPWVDPDLDYSVDDPPLSEQSPYRKVVLNSAIKVAAGDALQICCTRVGIVDKLLDKSPDDKTTDESWRSFLISAKRLIASITSSVEEDTADEILYKLITSGRQEGSFCRVRDTSRVQPNSKFALIMREVESGELKSLSEFAMGNDIQRLDLEQVQNYRVLDEHGDLHEKRDLATQLFAELQGYKIGLVDSHRPARIPNMTEKDDLAIYIQGAAAPCIVRKAQAPKTGYLYVGTAYIEGFSCNTVEQQVFESILIV